ncbi:MULTISPECIES: hypothetical protein [unclassified Paenibacillus]|uniref:hypothetical protein n=1 Tax=unclassified Paenibacillus TaxID=185978 RepID=UPI00097129D7|nr:MULTISPECIES: hypothetical protein [unclassified Paenibacillus]QID16136.1 hypothetical protein CIC07_25765 [Paenibacillus sp. RUD330]
MATERAIAYNQKSLELYAPLYNAMLQHLNQPMTVGEYIEVIDKAINNKDAFIISELGGEYVELLASKRAADQVILNSEVKEQKKIELLAAALRFNARFNEQMTTVFTNYYTQNGQQKPKYTLADLTATNSNLTLQIAITSNKTTALGLIKQP